MDAVTVTLGGKTVTVAELEQYSVEKLMAAMDELDARREQAKAEGRTVKTVLTAVLAKNSALAKLAGLTKAELDAVMAFADPEILKAAVLQSRSVRPVLEVTAAAPTIGAVVATAK